MGCSVNAPSQKTFFIYTTKNNYIVDFKNIIYLLFNKLSHSLKGAKT